MNEMNSYGGYSFRIAALIICTTCIFYTLIMRKKGRMKKRTHLFLNLLVSVILSTVTGIISAMAVQSNLPYYIKFAIVDICKFIYFVTHFVLVPILAFYIIEICDISHKIKKNQLRIINAPIIIMELMLISNPFTHIVYSVNKTLDTKREFGVYLAYFLSVCYLALCVWMLLKYWNAMNNLKKIAMFYFFGLALVGAAVQMIIPKITCELMAESIGMMGLLVMIEIEDDREDYYTCAYNRAALVQDLRKYFKVEKSFRCICLRIVNATVYRKIIGYENYDTIMAGIADFLAGLNNKYDVYRINEGCFYILCPEASREEIDRMAFVINERFSGSWESENGANSIVGLVITASSPGRFKNAEDILLLSQVNIENPHKFIYDERDLDFLFRSIDVEKAIARGISENNFRVIYRPVYEKLTGNLVSAEAQLTLRDEELGEISFEEFLPIAEKSGFVNDLQLNMIESVLKMMKDTLSHDVSHIRTTVIHVMSIQALKQNMFDRIMALINKYGIDPKMIRLDMAEPMAIAGQDAFIRIVDEYVNKGIQFSISDYDTGYLMIKTNILYKYKGVAMNVRKTLEEHKEQGVIVMRNRANMLSQLGGKVVFTNVDDLRCYEAIKDLQADFISGDYLSPAISKNELQVKQWHDDNYRERLQKDGFALQGEPEMA